MVGDRDLLVLMRAIGDGDHTMTARLLLATSELATARLVTNATTTTSADFFLAPIHLQVYAGDSALHVAAAAYDTVLARTLLAGGADVRATNRRGAEPIHAAVTGVPGSRSWAPERQAAIIRCLVEAGADPDATATGGVTPLLRAVRNRCSAAVRELLDLGADPTHHNDNGSTPLDLARMSTGRGGTGSPEAKVEQAKIIAMLETAVGGATERPNRSVPRG